MLDMVEGATYVSGHYSAYRFALTACRASAGATIHAQTFRKPCRMMDRGFKVEWDCCYTVGAGKSISRILGICRQPLVHPYLVVKLTRRLQQSNQGRKNRDSDSSGMKVCVSHQRKEPCLPARVLAEDGGNRGWVSGRMTL